MFTPMSIYSKNPDSRDRVYRILLPCQSTPITKAQEAAYTDVYSGVNLLKKPRVNRPHIQMFTPLSIYTKKQAQKATYTDVYSNFNLLQAPGPRGRVYRCLLQCQSTLNPSSRGRVYKCFLQCQSTPKPRLKRPCIQMFSPVSIYSKTQAQEAVYTDVTSSVNLLQKRRFKRPCIQLFTPVSIYSKIQAQEAAYTTPVSIYSKIQAQEAVYTNVNSSVNLLQNPGSRGCVYKCFLQCQSTPKSRLKRPRIQMFTPVSIYTLKTRLKRPCIQLFTPVSIYSKIQAQEAVYTNVFSSVSVQHKPRPKKPRIQLFTPVSFYS